MYRDEFWTRIEVMAQQSPAFEVIRPQLMDSCNSNNMSTSPEQNDDMSFEALEREANEVS